MTVAHSAGLLTHVGGVRVGHCTDTVNRTGCTAIIFDGRTVGGVAVRGANPGAKDTDLLRPTSAVPEVHAILLAGGSAYGLEAAFGVTRYLERQGRGYDMGVARVPIVPGAVIYDLSVGSAHVRPDLAMGEEACRNARVEFERGRVGAGTGATIGKLFGVARSSPGGLGSALVALADGVKVGALVVVNSFGDVVDRRTGRIVAGTRAESGDFVDTYEQLKRGARVHSPFELTNTTLGLVSCNCRLSKEQVNRVAAMAHNGLARAISPAHMDVDGDLIFATGTIDSALTCPTDVIGSAAAEAVELAILDAVRPW